MWRSDPRPNMSLLVWWFVYLSYKQTNKAIHVKKCIGKNETLYVERCCLTFLKWLLINILFISLYWRGMFEAGFLFFYSGTFTRQISFKPKWWKFKEGCTNQNYIWVWIIWLKLLQKSISAANCSIAHLDGIRLFNYLETQSRKSNIILELWQVFYTQIFHFLSFLCTVFYHF